MHFFPGIYEPKRAKKATCFSNPLTGALFSNREFLKNCKNVPKSISDLDHIKQMKYDPINEQSLRKQGKQRQRRQNMSKEQRKRIDREIIAVHATTRMAQHVNKTFDNSFAQKKKYKNEFDPDRLQHFQRSEMNRTFGRGKFPSFSHQESFKSDKIKKGQTAGEKQHNWKGTFNDIQILILDLLNVKEDFRHKVIRINLQKYYRSFFKKQLSGHFTEQFLNKVQHYIEELEREQKLDQPLQQHLYPIQLFTLSSRMVFMNKLSEFEARRTPTNQDNIRAMIRFYCIPSKEFRQSCLRDILLMLTLEVYEKFNCSRQEQYVLLDEYGHQITEILQIKFSTKQLFFTTKKNAIKNHTNYLKLLDEFYREGKKLSFTENIKLNFRQKLAQGKVDESHFNYSQNYEMQKIKRLTQLENAQNLLQKRVETHRVNKFTSKEQSFPNIQRNQSKNKNYLPNQNVAVSAHICQLTQKSKLLDSTHFWKSANSHISPQAKNHTSSSPKRNKSPLKSQTSFRSSSHISKQKLKQFLNQTKFNNMHTSIQKSIMEDFRDLMSKNDIYDFRFNHNFKNRIMKSVLKNHFTFLIDKSDLQIQKIIRAVKQMNVKIDNNVDRAKQDMQGNNIQLLEDSSIRQKQYENTFTNDERIWNLQNSISWQEFRNLGILVGSSEPKQVIMNFVAKYLNFNEYGELSKERLLGQVEIILGQSSQRSTVQVITQVIWSWFEANSIIENGFIRRITLQSWYQKYKIVYCMLTSLIFGTNHRTIIDLAYEVLA